MYLIILYIITTFFVGYAFYNYCKDQNKSMVDRVVVCLFGTYLVIVGLCTSIELYINRPEEIKIKKEVKPSSYTSVERIIVDELPDGRVQLTIISAVSDSTYTVILTALDVQRLRKSLKGIIDNKGKKNELESRDM